MDSFDINDYCEQLTQICAICKKENKCNDKARICALKKFAFNLAKKRFKRREKGVKELCNG